MLFENATIEQGVDENFNSDIFEMTTNTNEPMNKLVNLEPLIFKMF
jgi:hypothetical protein